MMSALEVFTLAVSLMIAVAAVTLLPKRVKIGVVAASFLTIMLTGFTQPALGAAVDDNVLSEGQKALNETLKTTPQGNQYQGIEYPQTRGTALSDQEITEKIRNEIPDNLKLSVASGSVRISGKFLTAVRPKALCRTLKTSREFTKSLMILAWLAKPRLAITPSKWPDRQVY